MDEISSKLKVYKSHRTVHATPMTWQEYRQLKMRGYPENGPMPEYVAGDQQGYIVFYNYKALDEYVAWTPKHVFDDSFSDSQGHLTAHEVAKVHLNIVQYELNERLQETYDDKACDQRCLSIAKTHIETAFMYLNRAYHQGVIDQINGKPPKRNGFKEFIEGL